MATSWKDDRCSIARSAELLCSRWTVLILREAVNGLTKFAEFRETLGIATDVLAERLASLVDAGVLTKFPYQEAGSRSRFSYHLTPAGDELRILLRALQQCGDDHLPHPDGPSVQCYSARTGKPLRVGFVSESGRAVKRDDARFAPTSAA